MSAFPAKGEVYMGGCQHWDDLGGKTCRVLSVERLQITRAPGDDSMQNCALAGAVSDEVGGLAVQDGFRGGKGG